MENLSNSGNTSVQQQHNSPAKQDNKVVLTKDGYLHIVSKILKNIEEEREMALDRFRRADEQMETPEQFMVLGKNAVSFLDLASKRTDALKDMTKEIKTIIFKDDDDDVKTSFSDDKKSAYIDAIVELEKSDSETKGVTPMSFNTPSKDIEELPDNIENEDKEES